MGWWEKLITDDVGQRNAKQVSWDTPSFKKQQKYWDLTMLKRATKTSNLFWNIAAKCEKQCARCAVCTLAEFVLFSQWRIQRRGPGVPPPPYFWTKMRPEGPKKIFLETGPPTYLRVWMTGTPSPLLFIWRSGSVTVSYDREGFPAKTAHLLGRL